MPPLTAEDVMNHQVLSVRPDMTVAELAGFLVENQISGAPVLDARGRLVGLASLTDIVESQCERGELVGDRSDPRPLVRGWEDKAAPEELRELHVEDEGLLVEDVMTPTAYTVPHDTPVAEVARTMIAGRIHRLLVTRQQHLAGIVTSIDLLRALTEGPGVAARAAERRRTVISR